MFASRCLIKFPTHQSHITVDTQGHIHVFKYSCHSCDFDVFTQRDQLAASDYILAPLATIGYRVVIHGDSDQ
jgi:hypothetical protein